MKKSNWHVDFIKAQDKSTATVVFQENYDADHTLHECKVKNSAKDVKIF